MDNKPPINPNDTLLTLFQVDLDNYQKIKFAFMYHLHINPSEVDAWPYWEYEKQVEILVDVIKKKNAQEEKSQREANAGDPSKQASSFMQKAQSSMPKMPSGNSFKMPKI